MNEVNWWELETQHSDTVTRDELKTSLNAAIARAEAAEKRAAELEAAQAWRPVTEEPNNADWYITYNWENEDLDDPGMRISFWDLSEYEHKCTHWQPLPPPPPTGNS